MNLYLVGGAIRDKLLGLDEPKYKDYIVECHSFYDMRQYILSRGGTIYVETPQHLTIRANLPGVGPADFVLPRKDGIYTDYRHPESVSAGTLLEDLSRRDFTINAIAQNVETGEIVDPFNGQQDIKDRILRCVGRAQDRFNEDALRILRVLRFSVTKDLIIEDSVDTYLHNYYEVQSLEHISKERIREELFKMFKYNSIASINILHRYHHVMERVLKEVWLKPTLEI